jgi:hypothetical protein
VPIDPRHRPWALLCAALTLALLLGAAFGGGSAVRLAAVLVGSACLLGAALLGLQRRRGWLTWSANPPRRAWLAVHLWLGLLVVPAFLVHADFRAGGALEMALWAALLLTVATGLAGVVLQRFLPRSLALRTVAVPGWPRAEDVGRSSTRPWLGRGWAGASAFLEDSPEAVRRLGARADELVARLGVSEAVRDLHLQHIRPFLTEGAQPSVLSDRLGAEAIFARLRPQLPRPEQRSALEELERLCEARRLLAERRRLYRWLHGGIALHVASSVLLLVLLVAHVAAACPAWWKEGRP